MGRWEPNSRARLEQAAHELYLDRGFDRTTVADIAARAGLTERTFFRYFADKREVLFGGSGLLHDLLVESVGAAPASTAPLAAVVTALEAVGDSLFADRRDGARRRQQVIDANIELQERELIKLASLAAAVAAALRRRGVPDPAAVLAAEAGIAIFRTAFGRWIAEDSRTDLAGHVRESLAELKAVTAGG
ncbi:MAG: TetR family transcriptional regulator [Pseudonocardia sp.]|nr:TetR family transcriptional regulator [Pseudonocardia sp.]